MLENPGSVAFTSHLQTRTLFARHLDLVSGEFQAVLENPGSVAASFAGIGV
ncbi:hypothetical protein KO481_11315 [Nocardia sp. NEAU-G5]|uniref:Uncharacterized protein n=1 Tax=Nocardia albiluteola TaxID=2842303 RepID=A0ABS6AY34_9NOCA|nr:hypothetical protein [Nocardia albiluteola]MBU3062111.1 hypothetical protein [Nocardia albiluteola]